MNKKNWIDKFLEPTTDYGKGIIVLERENFGIIKIPGSTFYSGGMQRYGQSCYYLIKKGTGYWDNQFVIVNYGRLKKEKKLELQVLLDELENSKISLEELKPRFKIIV